MRIRVNGDWQEHADGLTVAALLDKLSLEPTRCAVERNKEIVPRSKHAQTALAEADELEIVALVGGG